jgi:hypothetical protein
MKKIDEKSVDLHARFSECGKNAKEWVRRCVLMLPDIARYEVWKKKGFGSLSEYAGKVAGLSRRQVEEGMRVLKKVEDKPALRAVIEKKGLNSVRPVAVVATVETEEFWAEKASDMSVNELVTYVRDFRNQSNGSGVCNVTDSSSEKVTKIITMDLDPQTAQQLEKLKGDGTWEEAMKKLLQVREQELERLKPDPIETESRSVPKQIEGFVLEKYNSRCAFPGCNRKYKELHHVQGFSLEKVHDPDKIVPLCLAHHKISHKGLIENEELPTYMWKVREKPDQASPRFGIDRLVQQKTTPF